MAAATITDFIWSFSVGSNQLHPSNTPAVTKRQQKNCIFAKIVVNRPVMEHPYGHDADRIFEAREDHPQRVRPQTWLAGLPHPSPGARPGAAVGGYGPGYFRRIRR